MKMDLSKSSIVFALITLLRYLQSLLSNTAIALGVNTFRNYWNKNKDIIALYVPMPFIFLNLVVQQSMVLFADCYCYDSRFAYIAFVAAHLHTLGALLSYSVTGSRLDRFHSDITIMLLGLTVIRIRFGYDTRVPAFFLCQLLIQAPRLFDF